MIDFEAVAPMLHSTELGDSASLYLVDADGRPLGVLTTSGILHYLVQDVRDVVYTLPPTPNHVTQHREGA